jgi:hypothetical protein
MNGETTEQSNNVFTTQAEKFKHTSACQKADGNCFLGQERSTDGGIHAKEITMSQVYCERLRNKRRGMLTSGVVLLNVNARPHTAARTRELLEHFNPHLVSSDYHLFTYLKIWLKSQRFNKNEELMEGVKTWLSS